MSARADRLVHLRLPVAGRSSSDCTSASIAVWVTVTDGRGGAPGRRAGADALIAQGVEAGGHRGGFVDDRRPRASSGCCRCCASSRRRASCRWSPPAASPTGRASPPCSRPARGRRRSARRFMRCPEAATSDRIATRCASPARRRSPAPSPAAAREGSSMLSCRAQRAALPRAYPERAPPHGAPAGSRARRQETPTRSISGRGSPRARPGAAGGRPGVRVRPRGAPGARCGESPAGLGSCARRKFHVRLRGQRPGLVMRAGPGGRPGADAISFLPVALWRIERPSHGPDAKSPGAIQTWLIRQRVP